MNARSKPTQAPEQTQLSDLTPSRGRLFASMMYEGVLLFAVTFLAGYLFDTLTQSRHGLVLRGTRQIWLFLAIGAYFLICWRRNGQTLPMKAWHIRLRSTIGGPLRWPQMLLRYALMWLLPLAGSALIWVAATLSGWPAFLMFIVATPFLVFLPTWFTQDGQFLHDRLAGTRLVSVQPSKNP
jgi:uncharacterized RDD family membrane protein YckC